MDQNQNPAGTPPQQPSTPPTVPAAPEPASVPADPTSLEGTGTIVEAGKEAEGVAPGQAIDVSNANKEKAPQPAVKRGIKGLARGFNIYIILFFAVIVIAVLIIVFAVSSGTKQAAKNTKVSTQTLSDTTLKQLANSDVTVGDAKQVLNVQSNAVFAGKVLVRDSLEVAGPIKVSGNLSLSGITVTGTSNFQDMQIGGTLGVAGNTIFQNQVSIQKGLSVSGTGTFGGTVSAPTISTGNLQLTGDLQLVHHISVGGGTPGRSNGSALGSGGTSSISGSDTGGSVNINTGSSPAAGCFATVTFAQKYNATPHILLTPVESGAAGVSYYVTRNTASFSICTATVPPANASFGFDYFVID